MTFPVSPSSESSSTARCSQPSGMHSAWLSKRRNSASWRWLTASWRTGRAPEHRGLSRQYPSSRGHRVPDVVPAAAHRQRKSPDGHDELVHASLPHVHLSQSSGRRSSLLGCFIPARRGPAASHVTENGGGNAAEAGPFQGQAYEKRRLKSDRPFLS